MIATKEEGLFQEIKEEWDRAETLYGPIISAEEGSAVIFKQLGDFWDIVKEKQIYRNQNEKKRHELIQVAAMACRTIIDLGL